LILAEGKHGIIGYVKYSDLNKYDNIDSFIDMVNYQKNLKEEREIPVYDKNGEIVIDYFIITSER